MSGIVGWTKEKCPHCAGTGQDDQARACRYCGGTGDEFILERDPADGRDGAHNPGSRHENDRYRTEESKAETIDSSRLESEVPDLTEADVEESLKSRRVATTSMWEGEEWRCGCARDPAFDTSINPPCIRACMKCGQDRPEWTIRDAVKFIFKTLKRQLGIE